MGILDRIGRFIDELDRQSRLSKKKREIEWEIMLKEQEVKRKYEDRVENVKFEILNRFKKRQLDAIAAIVGLPKMKTKTELVNAMVKEMDLEEIKKFAKNYKIQYKDVITALEKYKKSLDEELEEFKARKWAEFEEFKRELTGT